MGSLGAESGMEPVEPGARRSAIAMCLRAPASSPLRVSAGTDQKNGDHIELSKFPSHRRLRSDWVAES